MHDMSDEISTCNCQLKGGQVTDKPEVELFGVKLTRNAQTAQLGGRPRF
jgi:hypothetical protein